MQQCSNKSEYNTQGTNYGRQSANSEHLPVTEQMHCTLKASMKSHCTYITVHHPSAQHPSAPSSLLHLSCQMKVSSDQKPSLDITQKRSKFPSASSLWKEYIFVTSVLPTWLKFISEYKSLWILFFLFCFHFAGRTKRTCSIAGWLCSASQPPSDGPFLMQKGCKHNVNKAKKPAWRNASQTKVI